MRRPSLTQRGFRQLLRLHGEGVASLTVLNDSGGTVCGILAVNPLVEIPSELMSDSREKALLEVERMNPPEICIKPETQLQDEDGNKWEVWNRDDNTATFTTKFWLIKLVPGKDV